ALAHGERLRGARGDGADGRHRRARAARPQRVLNRRAPLRVAVDAAAAAVVVGAVGARVARVDEVLVDEAVAVVVDAVAELERARGGGAAAPLAVRAARL